ncbi:WRB/Get1 family [Gilbertella persicaria]|uniref:WRB/Get1 family n=1 Tax=Gilbertella persicaria TaxID=101096 RepID=UPI00221F8865|nr:WRB/Get1 family [Gilbertella persicaria]KAI8053178.1 WRB/Get1 family [Gilbertella persicaria]
MYLPITIFLLVLITESILFLGYSYITSATYDLYVKLTKDSRVMKQQKMKRDALQLKAELSQTSSQDEFAKWAKLRRKLDKATADLEKLSSEIAFSKTAFELKVKSVLWFVVHGSQLVMVMWFRKSAVFYLPPGWFGPAQRFLSWPFAPAGSVSVAVWFAACRRMIKALALTANDFIFTPVAEKKVAASQD